MKDLDHYLLEGYTRFDPQVNTPSEIPSESGNYIVVLRNGCTLPCAGSDVVMKEFNGQKVIYTGVSAELKKRIGHDHLKGHSSFSTFRISLGCLLGYKLIHRNRIPDWKHYRFSSEEESALSEWIKNNLVFYYKTSPDYERLEGLLIDHLNPPVNLDKNESPINAEFRAMLRELRNRKPSL